MNSPSTSFIFPGNSKIPQHLFYFHGDESKLFASSSDRIANMNANLEKSWDEVWDAGAMGCGELVMVLAGKVRALQPGQILKLVAEDPGAVEDIPAWCRMTGHTLVESSHPEYLIERRKG